MIQSPTYIDFSEVIQLLSLGKSFSRAGWNGKGLFITLQVPDEHSKMTAPYVYLSTPTIGHDTDGNNIPAWNRIPWICSQSDLLAKDWFEVK